MLRFNFTKTSMSTNDIQSNYPFSPTPKFSFGRQDKVSLNNGLVLPTLSDGPAKYNISERLGQKSAMRIDRYSARRQLNLTNETPGPNQYSPRLLTSKSSVKIPKSPQNYLNKIGNANSPGPGHYSVALLSSLQVGGAMMKSERTFLNNIKDGPGVGQYELSTCKTHKSVQSFKFPVQGRKHKRIELCPGPTSYKVAQENVKGARISRASRKWEYVRSGGSEISPGPGAYHQEKEKQSHSQSRKQTRNISRVKSLSQSSFMLDMEAYNRNRDNRKIKVNVPKSVRKHEFLDVFGMALNSERSPGPAQYNVDPSKLKSKGVQFSSTKKITGFIPPSNVPGVGQYSKIPIFGKQYNKKAKKTKIQSFTIINLKNLRTDDDY